MIPQMPQGIPGLYTTQDLVAIVEQERQACLRGERLNLQLTQPTGNPAIDYFLQAEGIQRYTAFQDFQAAIHRYQEKHQVSGLIWHSLSWPEAHPLNQQITYPLPAPFLRILSQDWAQLRAAYPQVVEFWARMTQGLDLYRSPVAPQGYGGVQPEDLPQLWAAGQWATILLWSGPNFLEILLQLYRDTPFAATRPDRQDFSGSTPLYRQTLHGVLPGRQPIG